MPAAVRDNPALSRFELDVNGVTAVANYRRDGGVMTFTHTEVPPQARRGGMDVREALVHTATHVAIGNLTAAIALKASREVVGVIAIFGLLPQKNGLEWVDYELLKFLETYAAIALQFQRLKGKPVAP